MNMYTYYIYIYMVFKQMLYRSLNVPIIIIIISVFYYISQF